MDEDLDESWITDFEKLDSNYKNLYNEDVYFVNTFFFYVNDSNEINDVKKDVLLLKTNNYLSNEELIFLIKKNSIKNGVNYKAVYMLKHNIHLEPMQVTSFLANNDDELSFLSDVSDSIDIYFRKTIGMFLEENDIYIIYYCSDNSHNKTKRIHFYTNKKKTLKKNALL
tara:strand:+ start:1442 stop:1948 length:507 start_codon:yes stop_codon:yes gene_type:complete